MSDHPDTPEPEALPELTALLRDEPVEIDESRRELAIAAALDAAPFLTDLPTTATSADAAATDATSSNNNTSDGPADELAARRALAPVPAPRRQGWRPSRVGLVAAAVLLVAAIGIGVNLGTDSSFVNTSSDEMGADSSADSGSATSVPDGAALDGAQQDGAQDGADEDASAEGTAESPASAPADTFDQGERNAGAGGSAMTTTVPAMSQSGYGEHTTLDLLVDAVRARAASNSAAGLEFPADAPLCADQLAGRGLVPIAPASVAGRAVVVATGSPYLLTVVVVDATTCAEIGRR